MEVQKYVFQSPYHSSVQVGRPDMQAQAQQSQNSAVDAISKTDKQTTQVSNEYIANRSSGASVNVAVSSTNGSVSASLENFSALNTQIQASEAYSL